MKNCIVVLCMSCLVGTVSIGAQEATAILENSTENYLERSPIYDYQELQLNNTDTIPGFESKVDKLKISGTVYKSDGVTPAKDVVLFIEQADENGDFDVRKHNDKRFVYHRGWIKTDADGKYTFYTFVPGNDRRYNQLQQVFASIKEPSKPEFIMDSFLFESDPLLTKLCRKRLAKKDKLSRILDPKKVNEMLVVEKNIVLQEVKVATN